MTFILHTHILRKPLLIALSYKTHSFQQPFICFFSVKDFYIITLYVFVSHTILYVCPQQKILTNNSHYFLKELPCFYMFSGTKEMFTVLFIITNFVCRGGLFISRKADKKAFCIC